MKKVTITLILVSSLIAGLQAQPAQKLDSLAVRLMEHYSIPGIAIVAVKDQKVILQKGYGIANPGAPMTDSTRLYIASNTKAFTALAMARLQQEGKLSYSDPISLYFHEDDLPPSIASDSITKRHLLSHTHGLSNDPLTFRTAYSGEYPARLQQLLAHTSYRNDSLSRQFNYSNLGYIMAGMIIEEVTSMDWKDYLATEILPDLGMKATSAFMDFHPRLEALPFKAGATGILEKSRKSQNTLHAAGGLYATPGDIGRWLISLTGGLSAMADKQLMLTYLQEETEVNERDGPLQIRAYGNGWIRGSLFDVQANFHVGRFRGYESMISFSPENQTGIYVFVNEKEGGLFAAVLLNYYFHLLTTRGTVPAEKLNPLYAMLDQVYNTDEEGEEPRLYRHAAGQPLTGTYYSPAYGQLLIDRDTQGFTFSLGKLKAYAMAGEEPGEILIEWTPGIIEHFYIDSRQPGRLRYDDYGEFIKQ